MVRQSTFFLVNLSPNNYKLVVKQLWETGVTRIDELEIKPAKDGYVGVKNFYDGELPKIPPIDWITLASLRESENKAFQLKDPSQEVAGITTWWEMESWCNMWW